MRRFTFVTRGDEPLVSSLAAAASGHLAEIIEPREAQKRIQWGSVYVDKVRWRDQAPLPAGITVEVFWPELPIEEFTLDPGRVVWQDEHVMIADKPPGINAAPSPFSDIDCMTWGVQKWLGTGFPIHAVQRLDRDTQGLMVFAKHKDAEKEWHRLFRERRIRKVYEALTPPGRVPADKRHLHRWADELEFRGKVQSAATTAVWAGRGSAGEDRWWVFPHTGRPHQIRKHFARYLAPLWGDKEYGETESPRDELGLACVLYRWNHVWSGQRMTVVRPPGDGAACPLLPKHEPGPR